jgi:hypothetical protein
MVRHADVLETVTIHIPTRRQYRHDETLIDLYDHDLGYLFLRGMERLGDGHGAKGLRGAPHHNDNEPIHDREIC